MRSWAIRPVVLRSLAVVATAIALGGGTTLLIEGRGVSGGGMRERRPPRRCSSRRRRPRLRGERPRRR